MRRFLTGLYDASGALAALCLVGIFLVMLAQSFGREAGILFRGADDIVAWLCAATTFLALGHTFRHGELVRVGLWLEQLGERGRRRAEPWKMTSSIVSPRMCEARFSPRTQISASQMFDFPQPFGPTTAVKAAGKVRWAGS